MVNSSSFGIEKDENTKTNYIQANGLSQLSNSFPDIGIDHTKTDFYEIEGEHRLVPSATAPERYTNSNLAENEDCSSSLSNVLKNEEIYETKTSLFCKVPLEKVQNILAGYTSTRFNGIKMKISRKIMCLYCDRTFVNVNLRQKHIERCHSSKQLRRVSLRKHQNFFTSTPCIYCDKFTSSEHTLKDLFKHLIENHSNKYFACLPCEERFLNSVHLADHTSLCHREVTTIEQAQSDLQIKEYVEEQDVQEETPVRLRRRNQKAKRESKSTDNVKTSRIKESSNSSNLKNLRSRKLTVKSSRMILKRSKRLQAKLNQTSKKKRRKDVTEKKKSDEQDQTFSIKSDEKITKASNFVNPYPEFDHFFQVKKITDHSIDNLKISSLTFDDVFDKAFFNRIKCNIQENLLHHIDGKLFKNEESESRISNFEKNVSIPQDTQNLAPESYGCEISLNAVAPTSLLLSSQMGDDPESQIEYGSKPSKKKTQLKKDEIHYKYFTRRKYQASILEHKENRDLSKLDMWTQYIVKNRQQKILDQKKSPKEMLDYFAGEEYKSIMKREELNRILDRRGPFEDLIQEANKKAALDKLNGENCTIDDDNFAIIGELLNDILDRVFEMVKESPTAGTVNKHIAFPGSHVPEIPSYLNLRPTTEVVLDNEIDRSDKIALICSSQETENFELPSNTVRNKNEKVELTGEWARSKIYVCAACGLKLQNIKQFLEHKSASHQYIWVQHYEFVGNQSELYRHLSIPVLGKVGMLEDTVQCKVWKRSDARLCTKCGKQCNSLGELHRHILECGGDWTWMLVRKKYKYRPFGAKSRRKRRGLVKRIYTQKSEPSEKKIYKKAFDLPRQKPSDADTIKRMLANLPPKRATRKIVCLKDGFNSSRNNQVKTKKQSKFKCGKCITGKSKDQLVMSEFEKTTKNQNNNYRRSLRCLNKVLTTRILDTSSSLIVKKKYNRNIQTDQKNSRIIHVNTNQNVKNKKVDESPTKIASRKDSKINTEIAPTNKKKDFKSKRCSPRIEKRLEHVGPGDKMNIKNFFPVKKKKKNSVIDNGKTVNPPVSTSRKSTKENKLPEKNKSEHITASCFKEIKSETTPINLRKRRRGNNSEAENIQKVKVKKKTVKNSKLRINCGDNSDSGTVNSNVEENLVHPEIHSKPETDTFFEKDCDKSLKKSFADLDVISSEQSTTTNFLKQHQENEKKMDVSESEQSLETKRMNSGTVLIQETKRKVRKPTRGLNDCIAMLTNKLSKNFQESPTVNIFNDLSSQDRQDSVENTEINTSIKNSDFILKVPFSNEHFELTSNTKENQYIENLQSIEDHESERKQNGLHTNLQESHSSVSSIPNFEKSQEISTSHNETNLCESALKDFKDITCDGSNSVVDAQIAQEKWEQNNVKCFGTENDVIDNPENVDASADFEQENVSIGEHSGVLQEDLSTRDKCNTNSDSDDEVPLSSLFKDESYNRIELDPNRSEKIHKMTEKCPTTLDEIIDVHRESQDKFADMCQGKAEQDLDCNMQISTNRFEEAGRTLEETKTKIKDTSVLTEISGNFCQEKENFNHIIRIESTISTTINRKTEKDTLLDSLPPVDIIQSKETCEKCCEEENSLLAIEDNSENNILPKLDKTNKNIVSSTVTKNNSYNCVSTEVALLEPQTQDNPLISDSSECKENSFLLVEGKHKNKKKSQASYKSLNKIKTGEGQSTKAKEGVDSQNSTKNKECIKNSKTKVLESVLDDPSIELSESEVQKNKISKIDQIIPKNDQITEYPQKYEDNRSTFNPKECVNIEEPKLNASSEIVGELSEDSTKNQENADICKQIIKDSLTPNGKHDVDNIRELRRSARNSRRITSYNETDLVDPLFDEIDNEKTISKLIKETTKDVFHFKRKNRKLLNRKGIKTTQDERKLNGDELFDILKTSSDDNIVLSKPTNSIFTSFDEISDDFNDDNFDVFGDILEKSMAVIEENLSEQSVNLTSNSQQCRKEDNSSNSDVRESVSKLTNSDNVKSQSKKMKKCKRTHKTAMVSKETKQKKLVDNVQQNNVDNLPKNESLVNVNIEPYETNQVNNTTSEHEKEKGIYCDICDKSFSRVESLTKHKRTLTHISKLSEIEAREAALRTKSDVLNTNEETTETTNISSDSEKNLNILDILENVDVAESKQFSSEFSVNSSNLKLADIINDVLNKPAVKKDDQSRRFSEISIQEGQFEVRRYKSLAERKSFESENCLISMKNDDQMKNSEYFETEMSAVATGTILEKQISLLENIIETHTTLNYIEELSDSSPESVDGNTTTNNELDVNNTKQKQSEVHFPNQFEKQNDSKTSFEEKFLKPSQFEEISEDSNLKNYEEQKSRKVLNRDEELFLECCSLLKSGSEVSTYSKKSNNFCNNLNNRKLNSCSEPDWLDNNCLSQKENNEYIEYLSDNSRVRTPLGDNFSHGESSSATISSQWEMNNSSSLSKRQSWSEISKKNLTFEEVLNNNKNREVFLKHKEEGEWNSAVTTLHNAISEVLRAESSTPNTTHHNSIAVNSEEPFQDSKEFKDIYNGEGKKMLTKGAMKVFEGLKVSIPTEDLNMDKILISGTHSTNTSFSSHVTTPKEQNKSTKSRKRNSDVHSRHHLKGKTKHPAKHNFTSKKENDSQIDTKIHDIYDFEETQDNSDVFMKPDFRTFRTSYEKSKKAEKLDGSDDDSRDFIDTVSFDTLSSSASSVSEVVPPKSRGQHNITKKKCMIMGRIFKNAVKSKFIDEDIRNIPVVDNTKLVEDFVLSCPEPAVDKKRMTEEEMNLAFDKLLTNKSTETKLTSSSLSSNKLHQKSSLNKRRMKTKCKKRIHKGSDSSDDEFKLQKSCKKRPKKKNSTLEDSCINLEQELRECIGVASRKSQRKCTSGKQNVLIEYWSSDESSFETMLERQIITAAQKNMSDKLADNNLTLDVKTKNEPEKQFVDMDPPDKKTKMTSANDNLNRRKRTAANPLYHWSSSSEDESRDLIEVRPLRDETEDDDDRPVQHGWIVGDSPKKLVTMLAQAKGKKCEVDGVKEHGKKRTSTNS